MARRMHPYISSRLIQRDERVPMTRGSFQTNALVRAVLITMLPAFGAVGCVSESHDDDEDLATSEAPLARALAAPSLAVTGVTGSGVSLQWADSNKDETGYEIERSPAAGGAFALIASPIKDVTTYTDHAVTQGASYLYRARSVK